MRASAAMRLSARIFRKSRQESLFASDVWNLDIYARPRIISLLAELMQPEGMIMRHVSLVAAALSACLLSACSSNPAAEAFMPGQRYVWARKDGQRMATNPELLQKGQADQARCRNGASANGAVDSATFIACMDRSGYHRVLIEDAPGPRLTTDLPLAATPVYTPRDDTCIRDGIRVTC
jgi:hypothetical protein